MKKSLTTKRLCRAGVIAALYVALTYAFAPFAFGPIQVRPAEALCVLPLFFPEAIPALYVGCMLSNITSPFALYDMLLGSLVTLIAAFGSYMVGVFLKKDGWRVLLGGVFPVLLNALLLPVIIVFLCGAYPDHASASANYVSWAILLFITESVWVYGLGSPLYFGVKQLKKRGVSFLN